MLEWMLFIWTLTAEGQGPPGTHVIRFPDRAACEQFRADLERTQPRAIVWTNCFHASPSPDRPPEEEMGPPAL